MSICTSKANPPNKLVCIAMSVALALGLCPALAFADTNNNASDTIQPDSVVAKVMSDTEVDDEGTGSKAPMGTPVTPSASKSVKVVSADTIPSFTYDGAQHEAIPESPYYTISGARIATNAGNYIARLKLVNKEAFVWEDGTTDNKIVHWYISRANVTIPQAEQGLTYNGQSLQGVAENDKYTLLNAKAISAGARKATVSLKDTRNYQWSDQTLTDKYIAWNIAKATVTIPTGASLKYTGATQQGVPTNKAYSLKGTYEATAPGTYTATASLADAANTTWSDGSTSPKTITWKIAKKKTVPLKTKTTFTYNGKTKTCISPNKAYTVTGNTGVNAGHYVATASLLDKEKTTWEDGTTADKTIAWTINPAKVKSFKLSPEAIYDGKSHKPAVYDVKAGKTTLTSNDYTVVCSRDNIATNDFVSAGKIKVSVIPNGNYTGTKSKTYRIAKADNGNFNVTPKQRIFYAPANTPFKVNAKNLCVITNDGGKIVYSTLYKPSRHVKTTKSGTVKFTKGLKSGYTYNVKFKAKSQADANHKASKSNTVLLRFRAM